MKKFIWLLIFSLQLFPVLQNNRLVIGTAMYAQDNVGEEDPLDDAKCMKQESNTMYSGGGITATSTCNVWSDCETKEFSGYGDCTVEFTNTDPGAGSEDPLGGLSGGGGSTDPGSGGGGSTDPGSGGSGSSGTGSGVGTGGGGSGGGYVTPTSYPGSGSLRFGGYSFSTGISTSTNFYVSGTWSLSASPNPNPAVTSEVLNLNLSFSVTIPANVSADFVNNPVCEFTVMAYHNGLRTVIGNLETISFGNVIPGQTVLYSGTLTFNPTSITQVAMYWNQEPAQILISGGLTYPSATGGNNGRVLGAQSFTGKVPG